MRTQRYDLTNQKFGRYIESQNKYVRFTDTVYYVFIQFENREYLKLQTLYANSHNRSIMVEKSDTYDYL